MEIYTKEKIGEIISKENEIFDLFIGLDKDLVEQLKNYSLNDSDIELQKNTGDKNRFGFGSYEDWYKKDRTPFALVHSKTGVLALFAWLGPKPLGVKSIKFGKEENLKQENNNWHTLAVRSYQPFRGKGITKKFCVFVLDFYKKQFLNAQIWGGMDSRNEAVIGLMSALGFQKREDISDLASNWLIMVK